MMRHLLMITGLLLGAGCYSERLWTNAYDPDSTIALSYTIKWFENAGHVNAYVNSTTGFGHAVVTSVLVNLDTGSGTTNAFRYFPLPAVPPNFDLLKAQMTFFPYNGSYVDVIDLNQAIPSSMTWGSQISGPYLLTVSPTAIVGNSALVFDLRNHFLPKLKSPSTNHGWGFMARQQGAAKSANIYFQLDLVIKPKP